MKERIKTFTDIDPKELDILVNEWLEETEGVVISAMHAQGAGEDESEAYLSIVIRYIPKPI